MMRNLRYVMMSTLMLVAGAVFAQGVTIDFDADYATLFPTIPGVSSGTGDSYVSDGDFTGATTSTAVSGYTVTVTPAEDAKTPSRIWASSPRLRMYSGTFTVTGSGIQRIEFVTGSYFNISGSSTGTLDGKIWTGSANEVVFTIEKNTQLKQIIINGEGGEPGPAPQPVETTGKGTLESPYTVADAIAVTSALEAGATSTQDYYIKGKVSTVTYTFDEQHGTATFNISDDGAAANEFICYGVYYLENKSWVEDNAQIAVGDEVIIYGKVMNYKGTTPETASKKAYIYSLNGNTVNEHQPEPIVLIGDGSKNNPYLVSDLRQMTSDFYPADDVWVKGVIIGSASSATALKAEGEDVASNIAIAVDGASTEFVPVQLAANSDFRAKLNVLDNPGNKGKEVLLRGKIATYFSTTGVKELVEAVIDGETITGIQNVTVGKAYEGAIYNVAGQKVTSAYKGLVIMNGKKVVK